MKKKILALSVCVALLAICVIGGTLAYFTDTDAAANVMVAGNVEINLHESNNNSPTDDNYDYDKDKDGEDVLKNDDYQDWLDDQPFVPLAQIEKDVWVENIGSQPLYTRVHIGVPADTFALDMLDENRIIELVLSSDSEDGTITGNNYGEGNWTFYNKVDDTAADAKFNTYTTELGGQPWYVIVVTYRSELKAGEVTPVCMSAVKMHEYTMCSDKDPANDNNITYTHGTSSYTTVSATKGTIPVLVFAEAGQSFGFTAKENAPFEALNKQFGDPADAAYVSPLVKYYNETFTTP